MPSDVLTVLARRGRRAHAFLPGPVAAAIPALGATQGVTAYDEALAVVRFCSPFSSWAWYVTELDPATGHAFGLVVGFEVELGFFNLVELAGRWWGPVPLIQRDVGWDARSVGAVRSGEAAFIKGTLTSKCGKLVGGHGQAQVPWEVMNDVERVEAG